MTKEERFELYIEIKRKKIKFKTLAAHLNVSQTWISNFFGSKQVNMSDQHVQKIKEYVTNN